MQTVILQPPSPLTCKIIQMPVRVRHEGSVLSKIEDLGKLVWPTVKGFECLSVDQILYLKAQSNYTEIHTKDKKVLFTKTLKSIEQQLPQTLFCRVHKSYVVNVRNIKSFVCSRRHSHLTLENDVCIPVSKSGKAKIQCKNTTS